MNYIKFAKVYDQLIYDVDYDKIVDFINEKCVENKIFGKNLLELGCGTGNITSKLNGYNVIAVDYSEEMLSIARQKIANKRTVRYIQNDIISLNLEKNFDIVISVLDVFNYIKNSDDLAKIFDNVYKHMKEDSIFIFDMNTEYKIKEFIGNNVFTDEIDDILYIWQGSYDEETKINDYLITFFQKERSGLYSRFDELHSEKAYNEEEIVSMLNKSGFKDILIFDDYTSKKSKEKTMRFTFVVRKE